MQKSLSELLNSAAFEEAVERSPEVDQQVGFGPLEERYRVQRKSCYVDPYMNVILTDAEEYEGGKLSANYGKVVIKGNNVLYIKLEASL